MTNSLIAQLVQHCTSVAEVKCQMPFTFASNYNDQVKFTINWNQIRSQNWKINYYISFTTWLPQVIKKYIFYFLAW